MDDATTPKDQPQDHSAPWAEPSGRLKSNRYDEALVYACSIRAILLTMQDSRPPAKTRRWSNPADTNTNGVTSTYRLSHEARVPDNSYSMHLTEDGAADQTQDMSLGFCGDATIELSGLFGEEGIICQGLESPAGASDALIVAGDDNNSVADTEELLHEDGEDTMRLLHTPMLGQPGSPYAEETMTLMFGGLLIQGGNGPLDFGSGEAGSIEVMQEAELLSDQADISSSTAENTAATQAKRALADGNAATTGDLSHLFQRALTLPGSTTLTSSSSPTHDTPKDTSQTKVKIEARLYAGDSSPVESSLETSSMQAVACAVAENSAESALACSTSSAPKQVNLTPHGDTTMQDATTNSTPASPIEHTHSDASTSAKATSLQACSATDELHVEPGVDPALPISPPPLDSPDRVHQDESSGSPASTIPHSKREAKEVLNAGAPAALVESTCMPDVPGGLESAAHNESMPALDHSPPVQLPNHAGKGIGISLVADQQSGTAAQCEPHGDAVIAVDQDIDSSFTIGATVCANAAGDKALVAEEGVAPAGVVVLPTRASEKAEQSPAAAGYEEAVAMVTTLPVTAMESTAALIDMPMGIGPEGAHSSTSVACEQASAADTFSCSDPQIELPGTVVEDKQQTAEKDMAVGDTAVADMALDASMPSSVAVIGSLCSQSDAQEHADSQPSIAAAVNNHADSCLVPDLPSTLGHSNNCAAGSLADSFGTSTLALTADAAKQSNISSQTEAYPLQGLLCEPPIVSLPAVEQPADELPAHSNTTGNEAMAPAFSDGEWHGQGRAMDEPTDMDMDRPSEVEDEQAHQDSLELLSWGHPQQSTEGSDSITESASPETTIAEGLEVKALGQEHTSVQKQQLPVVLDAAALSSGMLEDGGAHATALGGVSDAGGTGPLDNVQIGEAINSGAAISDGATGGDAGCVLGSSAMQGKAVQQETQEQVPMEVDSGEGVRQLGKQAVDASGDPATSVASSYILALADADAEAALPAVVDIPDGWRAAASAAGAGALDAAAQQPAEGPGAVVEPAALRAVPVPIALVAVPEAIEMAFAAMAAEPGAFPAMAGNDIGTPVRATHLRSRGSIDVERDRAVAVAVASTSTLKDEYMQQRDEYREEVRVCLKARHRILSAHSLHPSRHFSASLGQEQLHHGAARKCVWCNTLCAEFGAAS